ncbi:MAG: ASKHA domain-containing protein [bacterium]
MNTVIIKGYGTFKVRKGTRLIECLVKNSIPVIAACAGNGRCGSCRVKIIQTIEPPNKQDMLFIPQNLIEKGFRLACQYKIARNIRVEIPKISKKTSIVRSKRNCGLALDIGTTVIKGATVNLKTGYTQRESRVYNLQNSIGGDVLTRVGAALNGKYDLLYKLLNSSLKKLKNNLGIPHPVFTAIVGNPVMLAFYLCKPVDGFAHYPFSGSITRGKIFKNPARYVFPIIGGFVGGDTVSGILASRLYKKSQNSLYIDLGTNGEVILIRNRKIFATSTAAGPAFEGIGISCGCLAIPGAIDRVSYSKGKIHFRTIGNKKPQGLCASGLIDLLGILLEQNMLKANGRLKNDINLSSVTINQNDIRKLQLAIGAIHSGVEILLRKARIKSSSINRAVITGEFGSKLDVNALFNIGLLPRGIKNTVFKKDLPLLGAIEAIQDIRTFDKLETIRRQSIHIDLAAQPDFQNVFVSSLNLAPWE